MPHISKHKVSDSVKQDLEEYLTALVASAGSNTRKLVFRELFTNTERIMIAKRIMILFLIEKRTATHTISEILRVSPSTVARFEGLTQQGTYKKTIAWLQRKEIGKPIIQLLTALASVPFKAQHKSLSQLTKEW